MPFQEKIDKCETTAFSSQSPFTNPGKNQILIVLILIEFGNDSPRTINPVGLNRRNQKFTHVIFLGKIFILDFTKQIGQRKQRPRP